MTPELAAHMNAVRRFTTSQGIPPVASMGKRGRLDRMAALMRAGLSSPPRIRQRRAWGAVRARYRQRACFICGLRGICDHREPAVEAAICGIPAEVLL